MSEDVFVIPASSGQQRLWFLDRYLGAGCTYNVCQVFELEGAFNASLLAAALRYVAARHESLRTSFRMIGGEVQQLISPSVDLPLTSIDLRHAASAPDLTALLRTEATARFDLATAPLLRATAWQVADDHTVLMFVSHHIIVDGWSLKIFLDELSASYAALLANRPVDLAPLDVQYADFGLWEQRVLADETAPGLAFWKTRLSGDLSPTDLPADRRRPAAPSYAGISIPFDLPTELTHRLNTIARAEGASLFIAALTALASVLYRYSGGTAERVLIGGPIANRPTPELERVIGFFANTVVFQADLSGTPTFRDLLRRMRDDALQVYAHQDTPFDRVVRAVQPDRAADRNPLFQVALAYQRQPDVMFTLPGVRITPRFVSTETAKFDLLIDLQEYSSHTACTLEASADLFDEATARRMKDHLVAALEALAATPDEPVATFPLLSVQEQHDAVAAWNPRATFPVTESVAARFERMAAAHGTRIALTLSVESLTYSDLNRRANQLAHELLRLGVQRGHRVAVCIEPSLELLVAIVGIVKAGAGYLPIDANYPADRIAFTLTDASVSAIVTRASQAGLVSTGAAPLVMLDRDRDRLEAHPITNPGVAIGPDDLCYVIYTSGSTGRPKGVEVTHRNVMRLFLATDAWFGFGETDVWTLFHSAAFDFSVWEIWGALLYGGRLVIVPHDVSRAPSAFHAMLRAEGVTVLNQTPSAFKQLMDTDADSASKLGTPLRYVIFGGEALDIPSLGPWFAVHGDTTPRLVNMYGITETTVHVTYRPISARDVETAAGSLIGEPIPDLQIYLVDQHQQLVPVGVPGEIVVGGAGVARGYLGRPELTAERFVADRFLPGSPDRLYKSGDAAKRLSNGDLEYLGRIDLQVKIRGFRIELGEIEHAIRQDGAVRDVAVIAREDVPGEKRLVAYVLLPAPGSLPGSSAAGHDERQVDEWRGVFDRTYTQEPATDDPAFNIVGWNSSYTRAPIPALEMKEWLDGSIARIKALRPTRVWEIGCGTGMILFRVAPQCESYVGTDMSDAAIRRLNTLGLPAGTQVQTGAADAPAPVAARSVDTVIINSVLQYFPSVTYLLDVLTHAIETVCDGGRVFLGDLRNYDLLRAFHVAVQSHTAAGHTPAGEVLERVRRAVAQDQELLLSPAFFDQLRTHVPRISSIDVQLRRGSARNELSEFRYDAVLHIGPRTAPVAEPTRTRAWDSEPWTLDALRAEMAAGPVAMLLRDVPNQRVAASVALDSALATAGSDETFSRLLSRAQEAEQRAIDPEAVWSMAEALGYRAEVGWNLAAPDRMDIRLWHPSLEREVRYEPATDATADGRFTWRSVASSPLEATFARQTVPELRQRLREKLPEYMLPSAFVVLDAFPLTSNGKLDRRALPRPTQAPATAGYVEPSDDVSRKLAAIWKDVLGVTSVGLNDDFFDMGGHSILAGRVTSRVRSAFGVELSFGEVFAATTLGTLADLVRSKVPSADAPASAPIGRAKRRIVGGPSTAGPDKPPAP